MDVLEQRDEWLAAFRTGWLAHYEQTGELDWKRYQRPKNNAASTGKGIVLAASRLMLISSAGGYLPASQRPFDAENDLGDYTLRIIPSATPLDALAYAHTHYDHRAVNYDHRAVNADTQVLVPKRCYMSARRSARVTCSSRKGYRIQVDCKCKSWGSL